jgi:hypothetical protein
MNGLREWLRVPFLFLWKWNGTLEQRIRRADFLAIGFSGNVSMLDESVAKEESMKPLTWLERWVFGLWIQEQKSLRQKAWRETIQNELGETWDE